MTRVLFTHRYSMAYIRRLHAEGAYPSHHLWGADALERAGFDVEYGFLGRHRRALTALSWRLGNRLGDIEEQAAALRRAGPGTVLYAGEATLVRGLARIRRMPLVAVVHAAPGSWAARLDIAICLSSRTREDLIDRYGRDPDRTPLAAWGPDLDFGGYTGATDEGVIVSAGKTERDTATLARAAASLGLPARIYGPDGAADYGSVLDDLRRASIVAIPLARTDRLLGLSEVNDALALGKPLVMTRSPAIDFDPSAIGCGIAVEPYDEAGWREALGRLASDPELRAALGRRGREFAENGYNARAFGDAVVRAMHF
jgi:glycosyltransferase involved in cell wall biosynthesis